MTVDSICPFAVNEQEWKSFLKTYDERFETIMRFYKRKSNHQFMVHSQDHGCYTFTCLATKRNVYVTLPNTPPTKPNVFLMRNISIVEATMSH